MISLKEELKIRAVIIKNYLKKINKNEISKENKAIEFYSQLIPKGSLVFDVGANIGNRVDVFLKINAKVIAFEPQSYCSRYLEVRFGNKIELEKLALGEVLGQGEIQISYNSTISSMSKNWIEKVKKNRFKTFVWNRKETINIDTLDNMISKYGIPAFCKIDVEGYEYEVLKGLNQKVKCLSFEYTIPETLENTVACIKKLSSLGSMVCNYSNGESFEFGYKEWVTPEVLVSNIETEFQKNNNTEGDIYCKFLY
jgi:FkbM family methyltransferase